MPVVLSPVTPNNYGGRLRAAAGEIIMKSPEFQRLLKDVGARVVVPLPSAKTAP